MMKFLKSRIALPLLLAALVPTLQGCFPVVAGGVTAGVLMATDRRSSGTYVEDEGIEVKAASRLSDQLKDKLHVNVTSYNRKVLLTGEAVSEEAKAQAEQIVAAVPNVAGVTNDLQVAGISSLSARSNDAYITSKVKARFIDAQRFSANHVKVVTEASVVYLLGMVTEREAKAAIEVARTTAGVRKVVNVLEIISDAQAKDLDLRQQQDPKQSTSPRAGG
ncbi:MAG: BON domain-containing protein [Azospira sp.]|jgi:osmotically-inducible protein OsmY|nr:BON domain-containing protein [Azospira sp.]